MISVWVRWPRPKKRTPRSSRPSVTPVALNRISRARGQLVGRVDAVDVVDAELRDALLLVVADRRQPSLDLAAEAAHGGGGQDTFRRAADAHHRVDAGAAHRGGDARRQVAVADQADPGAGGADVGDQLAVALAVEDDDGEVVDVALERVGDVAQVLGHRGVEVHLAAGGRADDDLVHVDVGRVQQAAALGGGQHRDGAGRAGGAQVGALERVDRDVDLERALDAALRAQLLADVEHRRLVALALADDDAAGHRQQSSSRRIDSTATLSEL